MGSDSFEHTGYQVILQWQPNQRFSSRQGVAHPGNAGWQPVVENGDSH